jgi:site-specific recombinase XerD
MSERNTRERGTALRRRMIEDMTVRNLSPATQASYITAVKRFSLHHGRSPADLGVEDVRAYQVHLVERKIAWASLNQIVSALRFLYGVTLGRTDLPERIPYARVPKTLPVVLSTAEVARLIEAVDDAVCRTALATVYATGLRTAEVLALCIEHIESPRELIRVEQGKGRKDRYVMLSPTLLATLRAYWKIDRPRRWLFPKSDGPGPISASTLNAACMRAALVAKIGKPVTVKTLRHCFATHLLEQGTDIRVIQALLGHAQLSTTARYTKVSKHLIAATKSPLDRLDLKRAPAP